MTCTIFIHAFFAHIFFSSCILLAKRKPLRPQPSRGHIILLCQSQSIVYEGRTITWQAKQWNYEVFPPCARAVIKFGRILSDVNQNWFKGLKLTSLLELAHLKHSLIWVKTCTKSSYPGYILIKSNAISILGSLRTIAIKSRIISSLWHFMNGSVWQ